jgi:hypothetical protein
MKTEKFIWMLLALVLSVSTGFAQGGRFMNRPGYGMGAGYGFGPGYYCVNFIPGLTEEQQSKIIELIVNHRTEMAELVVKQRSTVDFTEITEIQGEMLKKVAAHRNEVRNLLNDEQKKQYDLIQSRGMYGMGYGMGRRGGRGRGGYGGWGGRGCRLNGYGGGYGFQGGW